MIHKLSQQANPFNSLRTPLRVSVSLNLRGSCYFVFSVLISTRQWQVCSNLVESSTLSRTRARRAPSYHRHPSPWRRHVPDCSHHFLWRYSPNFSLTIFLSFFILDSCFILYPKTEFSLLYFTTEKHPSKVKSKFLQKNNVLYTEVNVDSVVT